MVTTDVLVSDREDRPSRLRIPGYRSTSLSVVQANQLGLTGFKHRPRSQFYQGILRAVGLGACLESHSLQRWLEWNFAARRMITGY
jgi:hypothetical protein